MECLLVPYRGRNLPLLVTRRGQRRNEGTDGERTAPMTYVSSRAAHDAASRAVVHDADSHLMETPSWLIDHADPGIRARLAPLTMGGLAGIAEGIVAERRANPVDPSPFPGQEADLFA